MPGRKVATLVSVTHKTPITPPYREPLDKQENLFYNDLGTVVSARTFQPTLRHRQNATPTRLHIAARKDSLMPSVALVTCTMTIAAKQYEFPATAATIPATLSYADTGDHPNQIPGKLGISAHRQSHRQDFGNDSAKKRQRFRQNLRQQF